MGVETNMIPRAVHHRKFRNNLARAGGFRKGSHRVWKAAQIKPKLLSVGSVEDTVLATHNRDIQMHPRREVSERPCHCVRHIDPFGRRRQVTENGLMASRDGREHIDVALRNVTVGETDQVSHSHGDLMRMTLVLHTQGTDLDEVL